MVSHKRFSDNCDDNRNDNDDENVNDSDDSEDYEEISTASDTNENDDINDNNCTQVTDSDSKADKSHYDEDSLSKLPLFERLKALSNLNTSVSESSNESTKRIRVEKCKPAEKRKLGRPNKNHPAELPSNRPVKRFLN